MRTTVRDIIVNAMAEARLVNRNQPIPGSLFIDAFSLLKKRLDQYSNTNYLSFIRKEVNFEADKTEMLIGTYVLTETAEENPDFIMVDLLPTSSFGYAGKLVFCKNSGGIKNKIWEVWEPISNVYAWRLTNLDPNNYFDYIPDVEVKNLQEVVRVYVGDKDNWDDLKFVAYEDYYDYSNNYVYSVLPMDDEHVKLFLKTKFKNVKVIYNEAFDFGPDDELNIPRQFISLFTSALVYDLACQFPRLGDTTVALLKQRLDELEENVRRSSSVNKFIGRDIDNYSHSYRDGLSGAFLWR